MSESSRPGGPSEFGIRYRIGVFNASGEVVPPWAVVQVTNAPQVGQQETYTITKPNTAPKAKYLLNGPQEIAIAGQGACTDQFPAVARWLGSTPPPINAEWGPVAGSWNLSINGKGFLILGGATGSTAGMVRVAAIPPAATTGADFPLIRIRNNSGVPLVNRSIVGIGLPIDVPPASVVTQPAFQSAAPQAGKVFAVLLSDVATGDVVDAAPLGIVACLLDYQNATHDRCDPVNGDYAKLRSGSTGRARIVWRALQSVAGGGTLGVQWAYVFIESGGGKNLALKQGIVRNGSPITAATGDYLLPRVPGIGQVYEYTSDPNNPLQVGGTVSGQMVAGENSSFWVSWMPAMSGSRKAVLGITDENGITWVVAESCANIAIPSG